jgi:simple sugar transport system ATP-binding protein
MNQPATHNGNHNQPYELLRVESVSKHFGNVVSLEDVSAVVNKGEVTCILGDNGAGKSTLIKILSGVHEPSTGRLLVEGKEERFSTPRIARDHGVATVFQDLATMPLMSIWRNFFVGSLPTKGFGPFKRIDTTYAKRVCQEQLGLMGIDLDDMEQPIGTLSGGQRQAVAIARAVYFGAKVLILDEPTSALGVKQSGVVLRYIAAARDRGVGVVFITHNPHHAFPLGDQFVVLNRGRVASSFKQGDKSIEDLTQLMSGGHELDAIAHELARSRPRRQETNQDALAGNERR